MAVDVEEAEDMLWLMLDRHNKELGDLAMQIQQDVDDKLFVPYVLGTYGVLRATAAAMSRTYVDERDCD